MDYIQRKRLEEVFVTTRRCRAGTRVVCMILNDTEMLHERPLTRSYLLLETEATGFLHLMSAALHSNVVFLQVVGWYRPTGGINMDLQWSPRKREELASEVPPGVSVRLMRPSSVKFEHEG